MKLICENCKKQYTAQRKTARWCSDRCKMIVARRDNIDPVTGEVSDYDAASALEKFNKMGLKQTNWITTGIEAFDRLTKIPKGRITQIQGPYGVGKTTLCLNMIAGLKDKRVLYIDSEVSLNPELLVALRLDPDNFDLYNDSAYFEDIAEKIKEAVKNPSYDMIIFDSLAACTTRAEAEGDITSSNIGQKAKMMHKLIHIIAQDLKENDIAFVVINQEREMIGTYVPTKYTPGGMAVPYAASLIVGLKTIPSWRFGRTATDTKAKKFIGHTIQATILKSKVNQPHRNASFDLFYPKPVFDETQETSETE